MINIPRRRLSIFSILLLICFGAGCRSSGPDPLEGVNRFFYDVNEGLDKFVLKPAAKGYEKVVPRDIRTGIGNVFDNLSYGNVILNDLLQARFGEALGGVGRVAVNTTAGVGGFFDPATKWGLEAHQNDLGITLGRYGVGQGPYLVLPLFGPSTLRDAPNLFTSRFVHPLYYVDMNWEISVPISVLQVVNARSRADAAIRFRREAAIDPYVFTREAYIGRRNAQINKEPPKTEEDFYELDMSPTNAP